MALSEAEDEWLTVLLENLEAESKNLYPKARQFVSDQIERHQQYGTRMLLSSKQIQWLEDLHGEFCPGCELPDKYGREDAKTDDNGEGKDNLDDSDEVPF